MSQCDLEHDELFKKIYVDIAKGRNVFLHGPGGVGKSFMLKKLASRLIRDGKRVYVTATTGVAALSLIDKDMKITATTLHRFAGVGTATLKLESLIQKARREARKKWERCEILFIDEVSMLGSNLFCKLDAIAKAIRNNSNPMGGIQMIFSGDFLQLPPVKDTWIFLSNEWKCLNIRPFIMETPYRYKDEKFFQMLLRIRKGELTQEDNLTIRRRVRANERVQTILVELKNNDPREIVKPTVFFSRRDDVAVYNKRELDKLEGEEVTFYSDDTISLKKGNPRLEDYQKILDDDMPREVSFKPGAQVMLKINLDPNIGLVNGSRGVVSEIVKGEALIVKFLSGAKMRIDTFTRTIEDKYAIVTRVQIPFVLAFASTIHKSQGSTLDYCVVNLGPTVFAEGQAYVALSRCVSVNGLFISEFLPESIMADKKALEYAKYLEEKAIEEDQQI